MFHRLCLLCLILSCRFVIGRLPVDVSSVNTFQDYEGRVATTFSGVHAIVYIDRSFYVLSKNQVSSLKIVDDDGNAVHRISEVITWHSTSASDNLCRVKTQDISACNNYIRIFAPKDLGGNSFIVCGTHSFDPKCRIYSKQGNSLRKDSRNGEFSGRSICPYDPKQTGASLFIGGDLYAGTFEDRLGKKPVIHRYAVSTTHDNIKRTKSDETWLLDPWFVKFVDTGLKVYVFFKETAIEDNSGLTYTRVAQVCKSDNGGDHILRKQFTSYEKARLNCSYPGDPPFYFDELGAATDFYELPGQPGKKIIFAAMNTPKNSIWGSAVCAYLEKDIESTFRKPYLEQHVGVESVTYWSEKESDSDVTEALSRCQFDELGKSVLTDANLQFVRDHPLNSHAVPAWSRDGTSMPLFMKLNAEYQFSAIAVDPNAGSNRQHLVLILGTTNGKILKMIPPLTSPLKEALFIGETEVYDEKKCVDGGQHDRNVRDIKIDKEGGFIIVAFSSCVVSIPLCPITSTCERACIAARDPYCAWDGEKCTTVSNPQGLHQDVLDGDVTGLPLCETIAEKETDGAGLPGTGNGDNPTSAANITFAVSNATAALATGKESTTTGPVAVASSLSSNIVPAVIGAGIGIALCLIVTFICCKCNQSRKSEDKLSEKTPINDSKSFADEKRNSHQGKPERPVSNHTQRQHSKRSNSSVEEDEAFLDNGSEGNSNSIDKARRKREKSANRKSNTSSYRREDSIEKQVHPGSVNRQTSRESNPESKDPSSIENEQMLVMATDFTLPPSPQNPGIHRTFSASNSRPDARSGGRELRRQLSLQIPNNQNPQVPKYTHNLTPMPFGTQNPLEMQLAQQQAAPPQGAFDPSAWHPSPAKNPHGTPRQHQTTSLDRKLLKAGGLAHAIPHNVQQQPRAYATTLPPQGMDDPKSQGRRRFTSESMGMNNRPPPLLYASKQPVYQSIKEESSPLPDQNSPTKFPQNMVPRTVGRQRPNHLPLGGSMEQPPQYMNVGSPMMVEPRYGMSPMSNTGHTLPTHMRRQLSEVPIRSYMPQQPHEFPHPQSAPNMKVFPTGEKLSKSNPATPEWDGNHNNFFPEPVETSEMRHRNPSGKGGTPQTPMKEFPGFGHPDVIPMTTTRTQPEATYVTSDPLESTA